MGTRTMKLALCGVLLVVFLAACGGGDSSQSIPGIEYTGLTAQAIINGSNAEELVLSAYEGGDFSGSTVVVMSTDGGSGSSGVSVPAILTRIVATELAKKAAGGTVSALATEPPIVEPGLCNELDSGSVTTIFNINEYNFTYSSTMTYENYCQIVGSNIEVVMNGTVTASGTLSVDDIYVPTIITMNQNQLYHYVTMDTYDVTGGAPGTTLESLTIAGQMAASINMNFIDGFLDTMDITSTANLGMKDNVSGKTFKVENYSISMSSDYLGFSVSVSISGRFYHWEHGYVDISTPTPLQISAYEAHPTAGVILIVGSGGAKAQLDFNTGDINTATLSVDSDGDDTYETVTVINL